MGGGAPHKASSPIVSREIEILLRALKPLVNLRSSIPLPYGIAFLMVALEPGKSPNAYARDAGIDRFAMYRHIRAIGHQGRNRRQGLGLVRVEASPNNPHHGCVFLTDKGSELACRIFEQFKRTTI